MLDVGLCVEFYRATYSSQHARLERKTRELIAIAASLAAKWQVNAHATSKSIGA